MYQDRNLFFRPRFSVSVFQAKIFFGNIIIDLSRKFTTWLKARRKSNFGKTRKCNRRVDRVHLKRHLRKWQKLWPNCRKFSQNVLWYTCGQWLPSLIKGLTFIAQGVKAFVFEVKSFWFNNSN